MTNPNISSQQPEQHQSSPYIVIPSYVEDDERLTSTTKRLYGWISSLAHREGFAWASNAYLAGKLKVTPRAIQKMIRSLEAASYLVIENFNHKMRNYRKIWIKEFFDRNHQKIQRNNMQNPDPSTDTSPDPLNNFVDTTFKKRLCRTSNSARKKNSSQIPNNQPTSVKNPIITNKMPSPSRTSVHDDHERPDTIYSNSYTQSKKKSSSPTPSSLPNPIPQNSKTDDDFFSQQKVKKDAQKTHKAEDDEFTPEELEILSRAKQPVIHKRAYLNKAKQMLLKTTPSPKQAVLKLLDSLPPKHYSYRIQYGKAEIFSSNGYKVFSAPPDGINELKAWIAEKDHLTKLLEELNL